MTWYRYGSQRRTRHPDEVLQVGDYLIHIVGGMCHLRMVKVNGLARCGEFVSLAGAKEHTEGLPQYVAS